MSIVCLWLGHWWRYGALLSHSGVRIGWTRACRVCGRREEKTHPQQAWQ